MKMHIFAVLSNALSMINAEDMSFRLRQTDDGSSTVFSPQFGETYHSVYGAVAESVHVFIHAGLHHRALPEVSIFEVGFGTGLNALLTAIEAEKLGLRVRYCSIERYPLDRQITEGMVLPDLSDPHHRLFHHLHAVPWDQETSVNETFSLHKIQGDLCSTTLPEGMDIIYFDAFSPESQPELWSETIFEQLYACLHDEGILVTYCAKGAVRRTLQKTGFSVERLPGPPPKREMLRGTKNMYIRPR